MVLNWHINEIHQHSDTWKIKPRYMENNAREWPLNGMFSESSYDMQKPIKRKILSDFIMKNVFASCLETK